MNISKASELLFEWFKDRESFCISDDLHLLLNSAESKKEFIRYGDMHLDHFFRVVNNMLDEDTLATIIQKIVTRNAKTN